MTRPLISKEEVDKIIKFYNIDLDKYPLIIFGIRGYYLDSKGAKGKNDRGIFDDAIGIYSRDTFRVFNGNTDPSAQFKKGLAMLKEGFYPVYKFDTHRGSKSQYPAICQRLGDVTVIRDGVGEDTGSFGINIHKAGFNSTISEGCQTVYADQWNEFYNSAKMEAIVLWGKDWDKNVVGYALISEEQRRKL